HRSALDSDWETRNTDSEQDQSLSPVSAVKRPSRLSIDLSTLSPPSVVPPPLAKRVPAPTTTPSDTVDTSVGQGSTSSSVDIGYHHNDIIH
ncbi:hypothetical protein KIPB_016447, partial [Kipferlia bialata]